MSLKAAGGAVELRRYNGVAVNLAFHESNATGAVPFLLRMQTAPVTSTARSTERRSHYTVRAA